MLRGRSHARMIRSSGTGSGWLARKRSTRSVRVAAGTWLMPPIVHPRRPGAGSHGVPAAGLGRGSSAACRRAWCPVCSRATLWSTAGSTRSAVADPVLVLRLLHVDALPCRGSLLLGALGLQPRALGAGLGLLGVQLGLADAGRRRRQPPRGWRRPRGAAWCGAACSGGGRRPRSRRATTTAMMTIEQQWSWRRSYPGRGSHARM